MREVSNSAILVLMLAVVALSPVLVLGENIVSEVETTYDYTENYGFLLYPESAIDGNVSDDNYTRIITSCPHYVDGSYCTNGQDDESFVRVEYNIGFSKSIIWANMSFISKSGYLSYEDPWGLTMSITALHANGEDLIWQDIQTPGYINNSNWELNNTGPLEVRNNGTIGLVIYIEASPFEVVAKDVEIRLQEVTATEVVWGCMDSLANNYVENATDEDGSCDFDLDNDGVNDADEIEGCTDSNSNNFSPNATEDDGSCDYDLDDDGVLDDDEIAGCIDNVANNYNPNATEFDDSCDYDLDDDGVMDIDEVNGCTDSLANNFNQSATDNDGTCDYDLDNDGITDLEEITGCTDPDANNFDPNATDDDQTCDFDFDDDGVLDLDEIDGCTDSLANNFNESATENDGTCDYDLDNDEIDDKDDTCQYTLSGVEKDTDSDGTPDDCDGPNGILRFDHDNDGVDDLREYKCNTAYDDNTSTPGPWCGDEESGLNDIFASCFSTNRYCKETILAASWNVAAWPFILGSIFVFRKPLYNLVMSGLFNRKMGKISSAHRDTKKYIKQEFVLLQTKILSEMGATENQHYERFTKKLEADLAKLSLDLKEYIDQKHGDELFDESFGDTVVMLKGNVDENEVFIKKVVISKMHDNSEEE